MVEVFSERLFVLLFRTDGSRVEYVEKCAEAILALFGELGALVQGRANGRPSERGDWLVEVSEVDLGGNEALSKPLCIFFKVLCGGIEVSASLSGNFVKYCGSSWVG